MRRRNLLCRSRPMMIRLRPPPSSGLLHRLNTGMFRSSEERKGEAIGGSALVLEDSCRSKEERTLALREDRKGEDEG